MKSERLGASWWDNATPNSNVPNGNNVTPSGGFSVNAGNTNDFDFNAGNTSNASGFDVSNSSSTGGTSTSFTSSGTTSQFDVSDIGSASKLDFSDADTKITFTIEIKKLESDYYTTLHGDTMSNNTWYKANKGKLTAAGFTLAVMAGWYGTLRAQGYDHDEAMNEQKETVSNFFSNAISAIVEAAWNSFLQLLHNSFGYKFFDDVEGTEKALKSFIAFLILQKILKFFGVNLITLPFKLAIDLLKLLITLLFPQKNRKQN